MKYIYPPTALLNGGNQTAVTETNLIRQLQGILNDYKVSATVTDATVGCRITQYEVKLNRGIKIKTISNIADDIALCLGAANVRVTSIPEKQAVGIEVPNKKVQTINEKDILESAEFRDSYSWLTFGLGKDVGGNIIVGDLREMPHLLIAGSTGSGKSVFINTLITSLLSKASPKKVKLLMVDPKMVELSGYNGIPHLLAPVITSPEKAVIMLNWAVAEMNKRYEQIEAQGARNIESYNKTANEKMSETVIIIDELADLMIASGKAVEEPIIRLAQKARAAGIHLVIATQRPDRTIITGLIKANIPSRIAFTVAQQINSQIILDESGAENLLGKGDMLYFPIGAMTPVRIQGALISDDEIEKVISYVKDNNGEAVYDEILMEAITDRVKTIAIPVRDRKPVDETELLYRKNDATLFTLIRRRKSPRFNEVYNSVRKIHPSVIGDKRFDELYARVNSGRYNNNKSKKSAGEC